MVNEHPYGERHLDMFSPPSTATGLIIREYLKTKDYIGITKWFDWLLGRKPQTRYFVFRWIVGTYDYYAHNEAMCGSFHAAMGYWHFDSKEERTEFLNQFG